MEAQINEATCAKVMLLINNRARIRTQDIGLWSLYSQQVINTNSCHVFKVHKEMLWTL